VAERRDGPAALPQAAPRPRYAQEASWREDNRRVSNGERVNRVAGLAMAAKQPVDFAGYWQRHITTA
jgi:hypothetical protein